MGLSLLLLCAAASALVAFATSALVGLGLWVGAGRIARLTAAARARVLLGAALLPALTCAAVMTAALAPSFGWIVDHCTHSLDAHLHPHLCAHHVSVLPAWTSLALAGLFLARLAVSAGRAWRDGHRLHATRHALTALTPAPARDGLAVLPFEAPQAFVVGLIKPKIFVTRGLLSGPNREHLAAVLSHERAHVRRRDPLRRLGASLALGFHLPGLAAWLEARLARAHEMAADADAARELRSPECVARALVRLARTRRLALAPALAFGHSDVEARVAALLDPRPRQDQPQASVLIAGVAVLLALVTVTAGPVHHAVEIALGFVNG